MVFLCKAREARLHQQDVFVLCPNVIKQVTIRQPCCDKRQGLIGKHPENMQGDPSKHLPGPVFEDVNNFFHSCSTGAHDKFRGIPDTRNKGILNSLIEVLWMVFNRWTPDVRIVLRPVVIFPSPRKLNGAFQEVA